MLNSTRNQSIEYLLSQNVSLSLSVDLIKHLMPLSRQKGIKSLEKNLNNPKLIEGLIPLVYQKPKNNSYLFIYNDFIKSLVQLSFFGYWNFKKVEEIKKNPMLMKKVPSKKSKDYYSYLWNLSGEQNKYTDKPLKLIKEKDNTLLFNEGIIVNKDTKEVIIQSKTYGKGIPYSIIYFDGKIIIEKKLKKHNLNYSVILYNNKISDEKEIVLMNTGLSKTILVKLYFFNGVGLKYFTLIKQDIEKNTKMDFLLYKIDWDKFNL